MKEKASASKKYLILPVALGLVAVVALSTAHTVRAVHRYGENDSSLPQEVAERFGLDESEVQDVFREYHQDRFEERHERMTDRLEDRLAEAVENGKITQAQMNAYLEKHEELYEQMLELEELDLSPEDLREYKADLHEDLHAWAEENGIEMHTIMNYEHHVLGGHGHMGMRHF